MRMASWHQGIVGGRVMDGTVDSLRSLTVAPGLPLRIASFRRFDVLTF